MTEVLRATVRAEDGQIGLVDAGWADFPWLDGDDTMFEVQAESMIDDAGPPYPGISVATVDVGGADVVVEVLYEERPRDLRLVHSFVLAVGGRGALLGPPLRMTDLPLPAGEYDLEVWVDAGAPREVRRVCFALVGCRPAPFGPPVPPDEPAPLVHATDGRKPLRPTPTLLLGVLLVATVGGTILLQTRDEPSPAWALPFAVLAFFVLARFITRPDRDGGPRG